MGNDSKIKRMDMDNTFIKEESIMKVSEKMTLNMDKESFLRGMGIIMRVHFSKEKRMEWVNSTFHISKMVKN